MRGDILHYGVSLYSPRLRKHAGVCLGMISKMISVDYSSCNSLYQWYGREIALEVFTFSVVDLLFSLEPEVF